MAIKIYEGKQQLTGVEIGEVTQCFNVSVIREDSGKRLVRTGETGDYSFILTEPLPARQLQTLTNKVSEDGFQLTVVHDKPVAGDGAAIKNDDFFQESYTHCVVERLSTMHQGGQLVAQVRCTEIERKALK